MSRLATIDDCRCSDPGRFVPVVNRQCGTSDASNGSELDTVSTASTTQSWSLDALGNWSSVTTNGTAQTRSYNGQNQLTAVSGLTTPTYDHNGNMTKDQNGITYTYDAWNRMATDVGSGVETLGYLAGGQRASIAASGSTTSYSYFNAAWQEIELDNNTGASGSVVMQDTYVWGAANIDEMVARDDASGNRLYAQQDANWDVTALVGKVSGTWQVVERFTYTSYGVATVLSASWAGTTDAYGWVYRYQAGKYDSVSGLYNFRNRDYSPTLGQWLENDPAGYVRGANLYQANLGAPISHVDPYGLTPTTGGAGDGNNVLLALWAPRVTTLPTTLPGTQPILVPSGPSNTPYILRDLGGADQNGDVTWGETYCHIVVSVSVAPDTGSSYVTKAQVAVYQQIVINSKIVQIGKPIDGTYGHEQRHVADAIAEGKKLQDEANANTAASGSMNLDQATDYATKLKRVLDDEAQDFNDRENNHQNPNGPIKGKDYPVIGTMPGGPAKRPTTQPGVSPLPN